MSLSQILLGIILLVQVSSTAYAADPFTDFGLGRPKVLSGNSFDYAGQVSPQTGTDGPNTSPTILENQLRGSLLLYKDEKDTWGLNAKAGSFHLGNSMTIPGDGVVIPQNLWDLEVGGSYRHKISDREESSLSASVGSASEVPFHSIREVIFQTTFIYKIPAANENSWLFFLNESNNRSFLNYIPLPGIAYMVHSPSTGIDAVIGIPFASIVYHPNPFWAFQASVFGPAAYSLEADYIPSLTLQFYSVLNRAEQLWALSNRTDTKDRLFYERKKTGLGVRSTALAPVALDLFGGWEFGRRFFEAESILSSDRQFADMIPSWFVQLKIGYYPL